MLLAAAGCSNCLGMHEDVPHLVTSIGCGAVVDVFTDECLLAAAVAAGPTLGLGGVVDIPFCVAANQIAAANCEKAVEGLTEYFVASTSTSHLSLSSVCMNQLTCGNRLGT